MARERLAQGTARLSEAVTIRKSSPDDLAYVTGLERHPDNVELIGQWSDQEHLDAMAGIATREHWIIERSGEPAGYLIAFDGRGDGGGIYIKRVLVEAKERGTGQAAVAAFVAMAFARPGCEFVWLNVRDWNVRAQAAYRKAGFERWDAPPEDLWRIANGAGETTANVFRMRVIRAAWEAHNNAGRAG